MEKLLQFVNSHLCEQGETFTKADLVKGLIGAILVACLLGFANSIEQLLSSIF